MREGSLKIGAILALPALECQTKISTGFVLKNLTARWCAKQH
jgi:hypothetical protein